MKAPYDITPRAQPQPQVSLGAVPTNYTYRKTEGAIPCFEHHLVAPTWT